MIQHILCTASEVVTDSIQNDGFIQITENIFDTNQVWIGPRDILESNENFKQIIPYVLLSYQDKIALYKRTKKGGENRLHGKHSIGFGGHIDAFDLNYDENGEINLIATIQTSAQREIDEELIVPEILAKKQLGYITDNSNPVGRVHIGVVEVWEVSSEDVKSNEDEIEVVGFFTLEELKQFDGNVENWSSHIINGL